MSMHKLYSEEYLKGCAYIDIHHTAIKEQAKGLARGCKRPEDVVRNVYNFVRDEIVHSNDIRRDIITCKASDVLIKEAGYCYAQSHLMAALLRVNQIPTALLYQRLCVDEGQGDYCLHGLNAVYLQGMGWHTVDARGKVDESGKFVSEQLEYLPPRPIEIFDCQVDGEYYLSALYAKPLPQVTFALEKYSTCADLNANLPDI